MIVYAIKDNYGLYVRQLEGNDIWLSKDIFRCKKFETEEQVNRFILKNQDKTTHILKAIKVKIEEVEE